MHNVKRLLYILWPFLAAMLCAWLAMLFYYVRGVRGSRLADLLPHNTLNVLWGTAAERFSSVPVFAWGTLLLLIAATVWWYLRPSRASGAAVFGAACLPGPLFDVLLRRLATVLSYF